MAFSAYLHLTGDSGPLKGEATDDKHKEWIDVLGFSESTVQSLNIGSQASGAGAGKATFNPIIIKKNVDKTSPTLFKYLCSGTPFKSGIVEFCRASSDHTTVLKFDLTVVAVKSVTIATVGTNNTGGAADEQDLVETVEFEVVKIIQTYTPVDSAGKPGAVITGGWDRQINKPI